MVEFACVYALYAQDCRPFYVGSTINEKSRRHQWRSRHPYARFSVLAYVDANIRRSVEAAWIDLFRARGHELRNKTTPHGPLNPGKPRAGTPRLAVDEILPAEAATVEAFTPVRRVPEPRPPRKPRSPAQRVLVLRGPLVPLSQIRPRKPRTRPTAR